jgi:hypothetical protein
VTLSIVLVLLSDVVPLGMAWRANRHTTLRPALGWAAAAWLAWLGWGMANVFQQGPAEELRYLALCLLGCALVAVLGARRPGVGAWSFVVAGLLLVLLRPLLEGMGELRLQAAHLFFLCLPLAAGGINYLPTRLGLAALVAAAGCGLEVARLAGLSVNTSVGVLLMALTPWLGWLAVRWRRPPASDVDQLWLGFRDRFGLVWAQRVREQFSRAAAHAGWPVVLHWHGLQTLEGKTVEDRPEVLAGLQAFLQRFRREDAPLP